MHRDFKRALVDLLDSECDDYGIKYEILNDTYCDVYFPKVQVKISKENSNNSTTELFGWTTDNCETDDRLCIDMYEDNWEHVCEYGWEVKYFWMQVAPELWGKR